VVFVQGDLADAAKLGRVCRKYKIEAVMHFAASALVDESVRNPALFYRNNVSASLVLLDVLVENKITKLVFSSSAAVYGEPRAVPIREDHPTTPINPYGETKLILERTLAWYRQAYGLEFVGLRYFNAAGATKLLGEDHRPETHLLPRLLRAVGDPSAQFTIYGDDYPTPDGTCVRDFVHVVDIAQAHILALRKLSKLKSVIYNVGLGKGYSVREVVDSVKRLAGRGVSVKIGPRRIGDPASLVASPARLRSELGWNPRHSDLATIVRSAWEWNRRHPNGYAGRRGASGSSQPASRMSTPRRWAV
jgi:UDP-glucose 4-epimerase